LSSSRRRPDPRPATPRAGLHARPQALGLRQPLAARGRPWRGAGEDPRAHAPRPRPDSRGREALPAGLIPGPPAPAGAAHAGDTPAACGSTARSGGHRAVRTAVVAHPGPQAAGPSRRARNDPPGEVASRTSLPPSCAGTPRIRRDEGRKPTGRGGPGQAGREPIRSAAAAYCRSPR
jgi:hypothetical protein